MQIYAKVPLTPQTVDRLVIKHGCNYLIDTNMVFLTITIYYTKIVKNTL